ENSIAQLPQVPETGGAPSTEGDRAISDESIEEEKSGEVSEKTECEEIFWSEEQRKKNYPLTKRDFKLLLTKAQQIQLQPGEYLLQQGVPNSDIFQHVSGKLSVVH